MSSSSLILRNAPIVIYVIAPLIQTYFGRRARPGRAAYAFSRHAFRREGAIPFVTHMVAIAGLGGLLWLYAARPERLLWADLPLGLTWRWLGVALGVLSLVMLWEVHRRLAVNGPPILKFRRITGSSTPGFTAACGTPCTPSSSLFMSRSR